MGGWFGSERSDKDEEEEDAVADVADRSLDLMLFESVAATTASPYEAFGFTLALPFPLSTGVWWLCSASSSGCPMSLRHCSSIMCPHRSAHTLRPLSSGPRLSFRRSGVKHLAQIKMVVNFPGSVLDVGTLEDVVAFANETEDESGTEGCSSSSSIIIGALAEVGGKRRSLEESSSEEFGAKSNVKPGSGWSG